MSVTAALVVLALALLGPVPAVVARSRWPVRDPGTGLVAWLAVAVGAALTCDAALLRAGTAPLRSALTAGAADVPAAAGPAAVPAPLSALDVALLLAGTALICLQVGALAYVSFQGWARRREHRSVLHLVGDWDPESESVVIDHDVPLAYTVPGRPGVVVLSRACHKVLPGLHVRAVLEHEWAHLRGRHGLILRPLVAWRASLPMLPAGRTALERAGLLVEMLADTAAARATTPQAALAAMHRIATGPGPFDRGRDPGREPVHATANGDDRLAEDQAWEPSATALARIRRLLNPPRPLPAAVTGGIRAAAALVVLLPLLSLVPVLAVMTGELIR